MEEKFDAQAHEEKGQEIEREVIKYIDQKIKQNYAEVVSGVSPIGNLAQTARFVKDEMEKQDALERKFENKDNDRDRDRNRDRDRDSDLDFCGRDGRDF